MFTAIFKDGPLGGQYRTVEHADRVYKVLSVRNPSVVRYTTRDVLPTVSPMDYYEVEKYELSYSNGNVLEYVWVNPADELRDKIKRLEGKIAAARRELR